MTQEQSAQEILKRHWLRLEAAMMAYRGKYEPEEKRTKTVGSRG